MKNINLGLESSVIGILLISFDDVAQHFDKLKPEYFSQKINQDIIEKAKSCYINKEVFNQYSAEEHLKSIGYANKAIMTILVDAASNVITKYDLEKNLNLLKDLYQKREFERILTDNIKDSHNIEVGIKRLYKIYLNLEMP